MSPPQKYPQKKKSHEIDFYNSTQMLSPTRRTSFNSSEQNEPLNLLNLNSLGEPKASAIGKHDLLSAISFDCTGDLLSVGDRGGRIILFERIQNEDGQTDFDYLTEFQAHAKGFDVLNSQDVPECV